MKRALYYICLLIALCSVTGCARTYHLTRYDGSMISIESYKWGDQEFYYTYTRDAATGAITSETYWFKRQISPVWKEGGNMLQAAIAGAREGI